MRGLEFAHPWALLLLSVLPLLAYVWSREKGRSAALRLPNAAALAAAARGPSRLGWVLRLLRAGAVILVVIGLARPQVRGDKQRDLSVEGIDIVIAFDISTSMDAADFKPKDRIHVAKDVLADFIRARTNDRLGLVVFAGEAYTQSPLTLDYGVLQQILKSLRTGQIQDGTAIGNALATALNRLRESDAKTRVVVLITDGDNNAGNISPMEAAAIARDLGVKVFTILVGKGGMVPFPAGTDLFGKPVYRDVEINVNPSLLKDIAQTTGGAFYTATDRDSLKRGLGDILDRLEKSKIFEAGGRQSREEKFGAFLLPALGLLAIELLLSATRLRAFP